MLRNCRVTNRSRNRSRSVRVPAGPPDAPRTQDPIDVRTTPTPRRRFTARYPFQPELRRTRHSTGQPSRCGADDPRDSLPTTAHVRASSDVADRTTERFDDHRGTPGYSHRATRRHRHRRRCPTGSFAVRTNNEPDTGFPRPTPRHIVAPLAVGRTRQVSSRVTFYSYRLLNYSNRIRHTRKCSAIKPGGTLQHPGSNPTLDTDRSVSTGSAPPIPARRHRAGPPCREHRRPRQPARRPVGRSAGRGNGPAIAVQRTGTLC